jgi:hypothetical protein
MSKRERKFLINLIAEHSLDIGEGNYCDQEEDEKEADYYKREARAFLNQSSVYHKHNKNSKRGD